MNQKLLRSTAGTRAVRMIMAIGRKEDKARVTAISHALKALMSSPEAEVTRTDVADWVLNNLGFGTTYLPLERIDEHLAYESGREGYGNKVFQKPKRQSICETREGVFVLAPGLGEFKFKEISHHRQ